MFFSSNSTAALVVSLTAALPSPNAEALSSATRKPAVWCGQQSDGVTTNALTQPASASSLGPSPNVRELRTQNIAAIKNELFSFLDLPAGWDGPNSVAPTRAKITDAMTFVKHLSESMVIPDVSVGNDGEVSVYWRDDHSYIEVSFSGEERLSYFARVDGDVVKGSAMVSILDGIPRQLRNMIARLA